MHLKLSPLLHPLAKSCKAQLPVCTSWTSELEVAESSKKNKGESVILFHSPGGASDRHRGVHAGSSWDLFPVFVHALYTSDAASQHTLESDFVFLCSF